MLEKGHGSWSSHDNPFCPPAYNSVAMINFNLGVHYRSQCTSQYSDQATG